MDPVIEDRPVGNQVAGDRPTVQPVVLEQVNPSTGSIGLDAHSPQLITEVKGVAGLISPSSGSEPGTKLGKGTLQLRPWG